MNAVTVTDVYKRYGSQPALSGMSFEVPVGCICGLVGPNGSGKTTSMGVIAGLIRPSSGHVELFGDGPFDAAKHSGVVGLMPQDCAPSPHLAIRDVLSYFAQLQGLGKRAARTEAERRLEQVGLADRATSRFIHLSHGMRRRFSIAQALLGKPKLILLDEPTSGLDPELVVQIRQLLAQSRDEATLLVSSHILSELETLCDHVVFVEAGKCTRQGSLREITAADNTVRYTLSSPPDLEQLRLTMQACTLSWNEPVLTVHAPRSQSVEQTNRLCLPALLACNAGIVEVRSGESLEATYMRGKGQPPTAPGA